MCTGVNISNKNALVYTEWSDHRERFEIGISKLQVNINKDAYNQVLKLTGGKIPEVLGREWERDIRRVWIYKIKAGKNNAKWKNSSVIDVDRDCCGGDPGNAALARQRAGEREAVFI